MVLSADSVLHPAGHERSAERSSYGLSVEARFERDYLACPLLDFSTMGQTESAGLLASVTISLSTP